MPEDNYTCAEIYVVFSKLEAENLKIQEAEAATSNITKNSYLLLQGSHAVRINYQTPRIKQVFLKYNF